MVVGYLVVVEVVSAAIFGVLVSVSFCNNCLLVGYWICSIVLQYECV